VSIGIILIITVFVYYIGMYIALHFWDENRTIKCLWKES